MTKEEYVSAIKLELTGGILDIEISDDKLGEIVDRVLKEIQRFIDSTEMLTIPYASCIDFKDVKVDGRPIKVSSIFHVYRVEGYTGDTAAGGGGQGIIDPMYVQTWMAFTNGGTMYNLNDYLLNYLSYNTLLQIRNTTSTDMAFLQDHQANKLYINGGFDKPTMVTIAYVPVFTDVDQVKSDYWIDIILRMSVAMTKQILGRIRTRYVQSNPLWTQDGATLLEEGNKELTDIREKLATNSQIILPRD